MPEGQQTVAKAQGVTRQAMKKTDSNASADGDKLTKQPSIQHRAGDCVWIHPLKRTGIVYREADERGNIIVQVEDRKLKFNQKRLARYIDRSKLYPGQDYDMDIVFESKENRKKRHQMNRKYVQDVSIVMKPDEGE
jgi:hypothetical protein